MLIKDIVGRKLSFSDRYLVKEAITQGVKIEKLKNRRFKMSYGNKSYIIRDGRIANSFNTKLAQRCTDMKEVTSRLLRSKGFPAPENVVFKTTDLDRAWKWAEPILPVVLKPNDTMMGKLVFVNIDNYEEFKSCFEKIKELHNEVLIEQFVQGNEYRFTFVKDEVVAIANRIPANVVGDGVSTVEQLVEEKNQERKRRKNIRHKQLVIDEESIRVLNRQGYNLESIPEDGKMVYLRENSNVSTGGDAVDVTDEIDQEIKDTVASAARSIPGLRVCGMDVIINEEEFYILEINSWAMLSMHLFPWEGQPRNVNKKLLEAMFPDLKKEMQNPNNKSFNVSPN